MAVLYDSEKCDRLAACLRQRGSSDNLENLSSVNSKPGEQCLLISRINNNNGARSPVHYKPN